MALTTSFSAPLRPHIPWWLERDSNPAFPLNLVPWEVHESLQETVALSESVGVRHTEVISVTDAQNSVYNAKPAVNETVGVAGALASLAVMADALDEDPLDLIEALDSHSEQSLNLDANVTLNEAAVHSLYAAHVDLDETVNVSASVDDHPTQGYHEELDEEVTLVESLAALYTTAVAVADAVNVSATVEALAGFKGSLSETVGLTDSLGSLADYLSFLVETVGLAEAVDDTFILQVVLHDPVAFDEALTPKARFLIAAPETVPLTEAVLGETPVIFNESIDLDELLESLGHFRAQLSETVELLAALTSDTPGHTEVMLSETVVLAESMVGGRGKYVFLYESIPTLEEEIFSGHALGRRFLVRPGVESVQDVGKKKEEQKKLLRSLKGRDLL